MKTTNTFSFIFFAALFSSLLVLPAEESKAQDLKIGFVEPQVILQRMPEVSAVRQRLQNFAERKQAEYQTKEQEFQVAMEEYQQKVGVISEEARATEEERLGGLRTELIQLQTQSQQEIQQQEADLMGPILDQISAAISTVADREGIDYVLNTTVSTGDSVILYVDPALEAEYDITEEVMQELGI